RPAIYRPLVANTLNNLGNVQGQFNEPEAARDSFAEALAIYRELAESRPEVYRPSMARTLGNLGNVQQELKELEAARSSYTEAVQLHEQDAAARPTAWLRDRLQIWARLGQLYLRENTPLFDLHQARDALRHAHACAESFRGQFHDPRQRRRVQG